MPRVKVLITVTTYPLPSRSYDELVCTAGMLEDGSWIRIYPVPFKFLTGLRSDGMVSSYKFTWIELNLKKRTDDFRPESHSPENYNFEDIQVLGNIPIPTAKKAKAAAWLQRKDLCTKFTYTNMSQLIEESRAPGNVSLATFRPTQLTGFDIEEDEREWKQEWKDQIKQLDMFFESQDQTNGMRKMIEKLPYKFFYKFKDSEGTDRRLMIEDWEIGMLYFNCLKKHGTEKEALEKVKQRYWTEFLEKDIYFFLGTTKQWHMRRSNNPFVIIGVFYPPKNIVAPPVSIQYTLFQ